MKKIEYTISLQRHEWVGEVWTKTVWDEDVAGYPIGNHLAIRKMGKLFTIDHIKTGFRVGEYPRKKDAVSVAEKLCADPLIAAFLAGGDSENPAMRNNYNDIVRDIR